MCEKKEDPTDLTRWLDMLVGPGSYPEDQFMQRLRQVIRCLPPGMYCLRIRVDEPARYALPSIRRPNP